MKVFVISSFLLPLAAAVLQLPAVVSQLTTAGSSQLTTAGSSQLTTAGSSQLTTAELGEFASDVHRFDHWAATHNIALDADTYGETYAKWLDNDLYIDTVNAMNLPYKLGHNRFSGMSRSEYVAHYRRDSGLYVRSDSAGDSAESAAGESAAGESALVLGRVVGTKVATSVLTKLLDMIQSISNFTASDENFTASELMPASVDWVAEGVVTPVKDQGQCGSCWSFSTTGAIEGALALKRRVVGDGVGGIGGIGGTLRGIVKKDWKPLVTATLTSAITSLSEQQLVDCDNLRHGGRDQGCNGGLMDNAFDWISRNGGLCTEADYAYTGKDGTCKTTCERVSESTVKSYVDVATSDDAAMMAALAQQPVSVAIEADQRDFQLYRSGVFTGSCGTTLDHGVLAVGYGTENGVDFYKIKNSWGSGWGDEGYIRIGRGGEYNKGDGQCGVLLSASYPVL
jgi:hypothetical protein